MYMKKQYVVKNQHLANIVGSGDEPVLSTPSLLGFIENACMETIKDKLDDKESKTCVGVKTELKHLKPNITGDIVYCDVEYKFIEKNKIEFIVCVYHKLGTLERLVAKCNHIRYIVKKNFYKRK